MKKTIQIVLVITGIFATDLYAQSFDWQPWEQVLEQSVRTGMIDGIAVNIVDYPAIKQAPAYARTAEQLARFDPRLIQGRKRELAFYINAYNFMSIKLVIDHWQPDSIRDIGSFLFPVWRKEAGIIGGEAVSLHQIEHEILRAMKEPRIHFAIVCASVSCPDLRSQVYQAGRLDQQLDEQVRSFLANPGKGMRILGRTAQVSSIFDWFAVDFGGTEGVRRFILRYRPELVFVNEVEADLNYNWKLNYLPLR